MTTKRLRIAGGPSPLSPTRGGGAGTERRNSFGYRIHAAMEARLFDTGTWTYSDMRSGPTATLLGIAATIAGLVAFAKSGAYAMSNEYQSDLEIQVQNDNDVGALLLTAAAPGLASLMGVSLAAMVRRGLLYAGSATRVDFAITQPKRPKFLGAQLIITGIMLAVSASVGYIAVTAGNESVSNISISIPRAGQDNADVSSLLKVTTAISAIGFAAASLILLVQAYDGVRRLQDLRRPWIDPQTFDVVGVKHDPVILPKWNALWPAPSESSSDEWLDQMAGAADSMARHMAWTSEAALVVLGAIFGASVGRQHWLSIACLFVAIILAFFRGPMVHTARLRSVGYSHVLERRRQDDQRIRSLRQRSVMIRRGRPLRPVRRSYAKGVKRRASQDS